MYISLYISAVNSIYLIVDPTLREQNHIFQMLLFVKVERLEVIGEQQTGISCIQSNAETL